MKIDRALDIRNRAKTRIADLYSSARLYGLSSAEISESRGAILADMPRNAPRWIRSYLDGFEQALRDDLYQNHLVFGGFVDGVFYSTHSKRPDYYEKNGISPADFSDDGKVKARGHYWPAIIPYRGGTYNRGSFKPYFVMENKP